MYTALSGVDSGNQILRVKQHGGVGILYKKSLAKYVSHIKSSNRRVCAVKITTDNGFTCLIVSAYLPCDTYNNTVQQTYSITIDYIESLINEHECKSVILCDSTIISFERKTGQVDCLNDFISINNLKSTLENTYSKRDFYIY